MIKDEYTIENDYPLMESINHYAKISNNDDYRYKFIEIMKRIEAEDVVFLSDLLLLETEFKCPIRVQLVKGSVFYLREQISRISEVKFEKIETGSWILIISEMPLMQLGKIKN